MEVVGVVDFLIEEMVGSLEEEEEEGDFLIEEMIDFREEEAVATAIGEEPWLPFTHKTLMPKRHRNFGTMKFFLVLCYITIF